MGDADVARMARVQICGPTQSEATCAQAEAALAAVEKHMRAMHRTKICVVHYSKTCSNVLLLRRMMRVMHRPEIDFLRVRCQPPPDLTCVDVCLCVTLCCLCVYAVLQATGVCAKALLVLILRLNLIYVCS